MIDALRKNKLKKYCPILCVLLVITIACIQPISLLVWIEHLQDSIQQYAVHIDIPGIIRKYNSLDTPLPTAFVIQLTKTPIPATLSPTHVHAEPIERPPTALPVGEPDGTIIFTCQVDMNPSHDQICRIKPDGSGFEQLTSDKDVQHFYSSWAPDGNSFVFSGAQTGEFKLYEMDLQGDMHIIGDISGDLYAPMISPDGSKIVFTRHFSESEQYISICDRDGKNVKNLTAFYDAKDPIWSVDGLKILFTSLQNGTPQLYIMNADGTLEQKVSELTGLRGRTDWALDLAIATYAGEQKEHNREVVLLELGGEPEFITDGGDNLSPAFSPDGQWIVFMSYRDHFWEPDGCELYIMRRDGSDLRRITNNGYCDYQPRWGP